ncbi:uncharacterized protein PgNI_02724, partial [Pyricularia grisea]|uniref:Uncharacterized protein n=1 Tax=Pyricularia grisea TaxID=148305 RepID=A0A6P8B8X4_PYRGI
QDLPSNILLRRIRANLAQDFHPLYTRLLKAIARKKLEEEELENLTLERNHIVRILTLKHLIALARQRQKQLDDDRVFEIRPEDTEIFEKQLKDSSNIDILAPVRKNYEVQRYVKEITINNLLLEADLSRNVDFINRWLMHKLPHSTVEMLVLLAVSITTLNLTRITNWRAWQQDVAKFWTRDAASNIPEAVFDGPRTSTFSSQDKGGGSASSGGKASADVSAAPRIDLSVFTKKDTFDTGSGPGVNTLIHHGRMYVLANRYRIGRLMDILLQKLHQTLVKSKVPETNLNDIMAMVRFCYAKLVPERLRRLVVHYISCNVETLWKIEEFQKLVEDY